MTLVIDHSGNVHSKKKPTIKDILVNREAWDSVEKKIVSITTRISNMNSVEACEFMAIPGPARWFWQLLKAFKVVSG